MDLALTELEKEHDRLVRSLQHLKETAKTILSASGAIIGVVGAVQIFNVPVASTLLVPYLGLIIIAVVLYLRLTYICASVLAPKQVKGPVEASKQNIEKIFFGKPRKEVVKQLISQYIAVMQANTPLLNEMAAKVKMAVWLFAIIVLLLALTGILPRIPDIVSIF